MTVVFLNFSEGASPHQIVRFSSWAVRVFSAHHLTRTALIRVFLFSYGFPRGVLRVIWQWASHMYLMPSTLFPMMYYCCTRNVQKVIQVKNKIPEGAVLLFHSVICPLALPVFSGEGLRVVRGVTMIGWLMVKFKTLTKKSRSKVSDQRSMIY